MEKDIETKTEVNMDVQIKEKTQSDIPDFLYNLLKSQYNEADLERILTGFGAKRAVTLRVNTLKTDVTTVKEKLDNADISYREVEWSDTALIIENALEGDIRKLDIYENGEIYLQSLSSMIPPIVLAPKEKEGILDMAAAPGGKTTQIAALTNNQAQITACEKNKIRAERLKYNIDKQGATRTHIMITDASKLDDFFSFDRILLDAPCSGSGTISTVNPQGKFSKELVYNSAKLQEKMLDKALKLLKPGCEMVYSTCSILSKENEEVVERAIKKAKAKIVPIDAETFKGMPLLPSKLEGTLCICPNELYEGFFVAKIKK